MHVLLQGPAGGTSAIRNPQAKTNGKILTQL
jgi:hypothetical protein